MTKPVEVIKNDLSNIEVQAVYKKLTAKLKLKGQMVRLSLRRQRQKLIQKI